MTVHVSAVQWKTLEHIADVKPIDDVDGPCLDDVRAVLEKHGCLDRFGIALIHNHFDLGEDEIMMETTDVDRREHLVRPMKRRELELAGVTAQTTIVRFDENGYHQNCGCDPRATGHHHK